METSTPQPLRSIEKSFTILERLQERNGARVTELADDLDMHKSTVHSHLRTLRACGYVIKAGDEYQRSLRFLQHGGHLRDQLDIFSSGADAVRELSQETGELANLGVEENGKCVIVYMAEGENAVHDGTPVGKYTDMHSTAIGKAMLAHMGREAVEAVIDEHGMPEHTEYTITDLDALFEELESIREQGYSIDRQEGNLGIKCIAAPVLDQADRPVGGVSITGPEKRLNNDDYHDTVVNKVLNTSNVIEVKLQY